MRKKREFIPGAFYHVTSRTNDRIRVFENNLGRKIMLLTLRDAKDKYRFTLTNFCVMPTHIHLLMKPEEGSTLSGIMLWIKTNSAKYWNRVHGSKDHLWGHRYFARTIKTTEEYNFVSNYIDQNPVVVGLAQSPQDWKASGAYYRARNISGLVDFSLHSSPHYIKLLPQRCLAPQADYVEVLDLSKTSEVNAWSFAFGKTPKQSGYAGLLALQRSWITRSEESAGFSGD